MQIGFSISSPMISILKRAAVCSVPAAVLKLMHRLLAPLAADSEASPPHVGFNALRSSERATSHYRDSYAEKNHERRAKGVSRHE